MHNYFISLKATEAIKEHIELRYIKCYLTYNTNIERDGIIENDGNQEYFTLVKYLKLKHESFTPIVQHT